MPMPCNPIENWLVCISGFTQTVAQPTGLHSLWLSLGRQHRGPETAVELFAWRSDFAEVAEGIKLARGGSDPTIVVVGYSWGAGRGFVQLANELRRRDILVAAAVLCDPVYYSRWNPLGAIVGELTIDVPDNVREVFWLRQNTDRFPLPHGHRPVAVDDRLTKIHPGGLLRGVCHNSMDESPQFQRLAEKVCADILARWNILPIAAGRLV